MKTNVSVRSYPEFHADAQLVDVRSPTEFATGHLAGAANIPLEQIAARLDDLDPNRPAVLICQSGRRAEMAAELLRQYIHGGLHVLPGGMNSWRAASRPVVCCTSASWSLERQVRLGAGLLVLAGAILALAVDIQWIYLTVFAGAGLTFSAITNVCMMGSLLARMPWNRVRPAEDRT